MEISYRCGCGHLSGASNIGKRCDRCFTVVRTRNEFGNPVDDKRNTSNTNNTKKKETIIDVKNLAEE